MYPFAIPTLKHADVTINMEPRMTENSLRKSEENFLRRIISLFPDERLGFQARNHSPAMGILQKSDAFLFLVLPPRQYLLSKTPLKTKV
ncbi:hypothetical protein TNCV_57141 [Trichonephila clavipes]|nr:hypothetical protein TNCV_57141 [Trichonephila clavipes]